jgi:hypothetical protein
MPYWVYDETVTKRVPGAGPGMRPKLPAGGTNLRFEFGSKAKKSPKKSARKSRSPRKLKSVKKSKVKKSKAKAKKSKAKKSKRTKRSPKK